MLGFVNLERFHFISLTFTFHISLLRERALQSSFHHSLISLSLSLSLSSAIISSSLVFSKPVFKTNKGEDFAIKYI